MSFTAHQHILDALSYLALSGIFHGDTFMDSFSTLPLGEKEQLLVTGETMGEILLGTIWAGY